jgi:hypothetical protein
VLDHDRDAGGERTLYAARVRGQHFVHWVDVRCPSTGKAHVLRVAPHVTTCGEAAAWLAGLTDPTIEFELET